MHIASDASVASVQTPVSASRFTIMMSGIVAQSLIFTMLPPLIPAMAHDFGTHGPALVQYVFAVASLGLMIAALFSGVVARAMGVRPMVIASALLFGLAAAAPWLTDNIALILISRVLAGGACGFLTTGCTIVLVQSYSGAARSKALGYQTGIGSVVGLAALAISGASVTRFGWHPIFLAYALFALPVALLAIIKLPPLPVPQAPPARGFAQALARTWPVCAAGVALMMVAMLGGSNIPFILISLGVTAPLVQSLVVSMITAGCAISSGLFGTVQSAFGVRQTFAVALLCAASGMVLIGTGAGAWTIGIGCALLGLGVGLYLPHLWMLATSLVPAAIQGHAIGLLTTSTFLGGFLYPVVVGNLQELFGRRGALVAIGTVLAAGALGIAFARGTRLADGAKQASASF
jgi:MFS family permease